MVDRCRCRWSAGPIVVATVVLIMLIAICILAALPAYARYQHSKEDAMWRVAPSELMFPDPMDILGRGSFGFVLRAEYRGS
ncbi:hypothetical protein T484DRAFT_1840689 [Baffinella frigidus]|nr:hypothetical protein T484DRAFT_1840689 [Cryptophyta sp. CCMP2293]